MTIKRMMIVSTSGRKLLIGTTPMKECKLTTGHTRPCAVVLRRGGSQSSANFFRLGFVWLVAIATLRSVSLGDERAELIAIVKSAESQFANYSLDASFIKWTDQTRSHISSTESRHVIQSVENYYESRCIRDMVNSPNRFQTTFIAATPKSMKVFDGYEKMKIYATGDVKPHTLQPYTLLLGTLGYDDTLSRFLSHDRKSFDHMRVEIGDNQEMDGLRMRAIRGSFQLPGSPKVESIELLLSENHAYLPYWGRFKQTNHDQTIREIESKVSEIAQDNGRPPLMRGIVTTDVSNAIADSSVIRHRASTAQAQSAKSPTENQDGESDTEPLEAHFNAEPVYSTSEILITGQPLASEPDQSEFGMEVLLSGTVRQTYSDGHLIEETLIRPKPGEAKSRPAYLTWLMMNGILLISFGVIYCSRLVARQLAHLVAIPSGGVR